MNILSRVKINKYLFCLSLSAVLITMVLPAPSISQQIAAPTKQDNAVTLTVTVTDGKAGYAGGLAQSAFTIYDEDKPQAITYFSNKDIPTSVGILLDSSGSMRLEHDGQQKIIRAVTDALSRFFKLAHSSNDYFLMTFSTTTQVQVDWTQDTNAILNALASVTPKKETAFFDACYSGIEKLKSAKHQKRVMIVISDGRDNKSEHSLNELRRTAHKSEIVIYPITLFRNFAIKNLYELDDRSESVSVFEDLASISGGRSFYPKNTRELNSAFETCALELRRQYLIGFVPAKQAKKSKSRRIKIKVNAPAGASPEMKHLVARTRQSYLVDN